MLAARRSLVCVAQQKPQSQSLNTINVARKAFEKRRLASAKENFNKLMLIATSDTKDITDFVTELDKLHKERFESWMPAAKQEANNDESSIFRD